MAIDLPSPLDGILSLWLPPHFSKTDENTLGYVLNQDTLTWESLVVSRGAGLVDSRPPYTFSAKTSSFPARTPTQCLRWLTFINRSRPFHPTSVRMSSTIFVNPSTLSCCKSSRKKSSTRRRLNGGHWCNGCRRRYTTIPAQAIGSRPAQIYARAKT